MILIPHYVAQSAIAGLGVFTAIDLVAGQKIYRFDTRFVLQISDAEIAALPESVRQSMIRYSYRGKAAHRLADAVYYCADDARFMNHARPANTCALAGSDDYVAATDIPAGSELTCDYADFSEPGDFCFAFEAAP